VQIHKSTPLILLKTAVNHQRQSQKCGSKSLVFHTGV